MPRNTEGLKRGGPGRPKGAKTPRMLEVLLKQQEAFVKRSGREPGPRDPLFFDPGADQPRPLDADRLTAELLRACELAGLEPDRVFAHLGWEEA